MNLAPTHPAADAPHSLLLELPVPFRLIDRALHVESQAHNGLQRWLDNFDHVTLAAPLVPHAETDASVTWLPVADLLATGRLGLEVLPWGYHPREHFRHAAAVRARLRALLPKHRYLCFSNLGWLGSWGNVAADEARRAGRPYAVWLDWVLHEMPGPRRQGLLQRAFAQLNASMLKLRSLSAVRHAALGLFHGRSVFEAYAPLCPQSHVVHDIHLKRQDVVPESLLRQRLADTARPLRIGYVGRVHAMKGPIEWIDAVEQLVRSHPGMPVQAVWMGEGPMLAQAREAVRLRRLQHVISFPGQEHDRKRVIEFLRSLDLFVFCHLTPESPRCLIEALMSGVPLLGFDSPYAADLVAEHGGGRYVPVGDTAGLAGLVGRYLADPGLRTALSFRAHRSGREFCDDAVFAHRSQLIRTHLA